MCGAVAATPAGNQGRTYGRRCAYHPRPGEHANGGGGQQAHRRFRPGHVAGTSTPLAGLRSRSTKQPVHQLTAHIRVWYAMHILHYLITNHPQDEVQYIFASGVLPTALLFNVKAAIGRSTKSNAHVLSLALGTYHTMPYCTQQQQKPLVAKRYNHFNSCIPALDRKAYMSSSSI